MLSTVCVYPEHCIDRNAAVTAKFVVVMNLRVEVVLAVLLLMVVYLYCGRLVCVPNQKGPTFIGVGVFSVNALIVV
jgi:hypothetical protein